MIRVAARRARAVAAQAQRGATAVVVAFSLVLIMAAAAFGYDIAQLYYQRQELRNAIDAAAQAGASALPSTSTAQSLAIQYANQNFAGLNLQSSDISFYCVVRNAGGTAAGGYPDPAQVGTNRTCEGKVGWTNADAKCSNSSCAIPCTVGQRCNSMTIAKSWTVNFVFGPAIGVPSASTGVLTTLACNGSCGGTPPPNPMDVVVMADRTYSMSSTAVSDMKTGITSMFATMNRDQQYVSFGAIHKSQTTNGCVTGTEADSYNPWSSDTAVAYDRWNDDYYPTGRARFDGTWVPVAFSNDYTTGTAAANNITVNSTSALVKAVKCMTRVNNGIGTHLASAMKGASRYLLGYDANNLSTLPDRTELYGTPKKVIIFETDGRPEEIFDHDDATDKALNSKYDLGDTNGQNACQNLIDVAQAAKDAGITIISIGYGNVNTFTCNTNGTGSTVRSVLAAAASPKNGVAADALDCTNSTNKTTENTDGDYYFCAASSSDLQGVFAAAMGSITGKTKFMSIPGVGN